MKLFPIFLVFILCAVIIMEYVGADTVLVDNNGITEYLTKPNAIYHNGKTYFAWMDNDMHLKIAYYNHTSESMSAPVLVANVTDDDDHCSPSIIFRNDGRLILFYNDEHTSGGGMLKCRISSNPEDISSWGSVITIDSGTTCCYPKPWVTSDGTVYVTYREGNTDVKLKKSTDGGVTWTGETVFISGGVAAYQAQYQETSDRNYIHVMYTISDGTKRNNIYYVYSDDGGASWKNYSGSSATLPLGANDSLKIWSASAVRQYDICADESTHNPIVLASKDLNSDTDNFPLYYILYNGTENEWYITELYGFYQHTTYYPYTSGACIDRQNHSIIYVAESSGSNSNMSIWKKSGGSWSRDSWITSTNDMCIRPMPVETPNNIRCFWSQGSSYNGFGDFSLDLYMYLVTSSNVSTSDTESFGISLPIDYTATPSSHEYSIASFGISLPIDYTAADNNGSGFIISDSNSFYATIAGLAVFFPILGLLIYKEKRR